MVRQAIGSVKLGYEVGSGELVTVKQSHLISTGITQLSGKTTTLEALIKRSGKRAIVFKTKVGESGFSEGTTIPPYYRERSDWQYVTTLLEATLREKLKFERAWIIHVCKNAESLYEVKVNIEKRLADPKVKGLSRNVYTTLLAYFDIILPQLQFANFSKTLDLHDGINIMDLERFREEIQSLVIQSVLAIVLKKFKNVIVVMPEAWKFLPQGRGNPCKLSAEAFIRQGASNGNYLWVDSQDMAGVDKTPLKQVSTWILGLQMERNEVDHTLDQISLPKKLKPRPEEIMKLPLGHFILVTPTQNVMVYVQPAWLDDETARKIALGKVDVTTIEKPESLVSVKAPYQPVPPQDLESLKVLARVTKDLVQMREDFFAKTEQLGNRLDAVGQALMELKAHKPTANIDEIISKVLQKLPHFNKEALLEEFLKRIPRNLKGTVVYEVPPLEKLRKDFQKEAKAKILADVQSLDEQQKKILRFIETTGKGTNVTEIMTKCLFLNSKSGGSRQRINEKLNTMKTMELIRRDTGGHIFANLKARITQLLAIHNAKPEEIDLVHNHTLMAIAEGGD